MKRWFKIFLVLWLIGTISLLTTIQFLYWKDTYPAYLMFQSSDTFQNSYYKIQVTCFATNLWFTSASPIQSNDFTANLVVDIVAYWRILTLEENYQGRWNLECFDNRTTKTEGPTTTIETWSHIYTQTIHKHWTFNKNLPSFTVEVWRTYLFDSENMNNQIIFDVNNHGIHVENRTVIYETEAGAFGYTILEAEPNNITISSGHPTETQLNFYGAGDRDLRSHKQNEIEYVKLLIYANQHGNVEDATLLLNCHN